MTKPTAAELNAHLLKLTESFNHLVEANVALATRLEEAHARIDAANVYFNKLRAAVVEAAAKPEPLRTPAKLPSVPRAEFDRALDDLRAERNDDRAMFDIEVIKERAHTLRVMAANREAAAA